MPFAEETLSRAQACQMALERQGLTVRKPFGTGEEAVLAAIRRIGYVQIDTISVVERAHHHVIWSRVPDYRPSALETLLNRADGIFEYWSHAASFLPMEDYRYSLIRKERFRSGERLWFPKNSRLIRNALARIRAEGPLAARDFETTAGTGPSGWWSWKPEKQALEQLFQEGRLMVRSRQGFQKIYDLTERVLPAGIDQSKPTMSEYVGHLVQRALQGHGIVTLAEICYQRPKLKNQAAAVLHELIEAGEVCRCRVEDLETEFFAHRSTVEGFGRKKIPGSVLRILSPFDNAVIQRHRLSGLFGFDYLFECYVPAAKRKFGYFSLPVLWQNAFIGMLDCKANRKAGVLEVKAAHWTRTFSGSRFQADLRDALDDFAAFNGCRDIRWSTVS